MVLPYLNGSSLYFSCCLWWMLWYLWSIMVYLWSFTIDPLLYLSRFTIVVFKSMKQHMRFSLLFWHSSIIILRVLKWSNVKWKLQKLSYPLAHISCLYSHKKILYSKIIPYNLALRRLIMMVLWWPFFATCWEVFSHWIYIQCMSITYFIFCKASICMV